MRLLITTVTCFAIASMAAFALDGTFVEQTMQSARNIERDAVLIGAAVKNRKIDSEDVRKKITAMNADIAVLQKHVAEFEATNPQLNERDRADWQRVREKVQLLAIFHDQKLKLASEDLERHRTLIRAHAEGVAFRAAKLQETLAKLARASIS